MRKGNLSSKSHWLNENDGLLISTHEAGHDFLFNKPKRASTEEVQVFGLFCFYSSRASGRFV